MIYLLIILSVLWFIRTTKIALFYIYFWQLKEYQIKRFLDHFTTAKGKQLIFNGLNFVKLVLVAIFFVRSAVFFYFLLALYLIEVLKTFLNISQKRLKKPVLTKKTIVLILAAVLLEIVFASILFIKIGIVFWLPFYLLIFDILAPMILSLLILIFQPLVVLMRNQTIKKAKKKREQFKNLLVVGITGSYGKSSTKEFLATMLSEKFNVLKTKANQNSEIGISQCILNDLKPEHEVFIVEMGAYGVGGIKILCDIAKPKIGILTGINEQHLALYGSQENIIKTKDELIESLPSDGTAIFNGVNEYCSQLYRNTKIDKELCNGNLIQTIIENILNPDIWAEDIEVEKEFVSFKMASKDEDSVYFKINLMGKQNIENILLAACCAKKLGMSLKEISKICSEIKPRQGGMKILKKENPVIIDSSYSANPNGVAADLEYLKLYQGKKIIIMPCLIELGGSSEKAHKKIGRKIAEVCDLAIITTKERFKEIKKEGGDKVLFIEKPEKIVDKIKDFCKNPDDVVLLEGRVPKEIIELLCDRKNE